MERSGEFQLPARFIGCVGDGVVGCRAGSLFSTVVMVVKLLVANWLCLGSFVLG